MAKFNVLLIRSYDQPGTDGTYYPLLSDGEDDQIIAREPGDGDHVMGFISPSVAVYEVGGRMPKRLVGTPPNDLLTSHSSEIRVSDCRVTLACEKFTKGSTWSGGGAGAAIAAGAMVVSAAKAKRRRRGKVMVGQMRYEWISRVGASLPNRFGKNCYVILEYRDGVAAKALHLNCNPIEPAMIAQDIIRRVAAFRLEHSPDLPAEQRTTLEAAHYAEKLQPTFRERAYYDLPGSVIVGAVATTTGE
jgi:hypothetical protein